MTKATYRKFFRDLQKTYPLDHKLIITLDLPNVERINHKGHNLYALVTFNNHTAKITVATKTNPMVALKMIAHEYRHLIQRFNMGWISNGPSDFKHEKDAQLFGQAEAWKWVKAKGIL